MNTGILIVILVVICFLSLSALFIFWKTNKRLNPRTRRSRVRLVKVAQLSPRDSGGSNIQHLGEVMYGQIFFGLAGLVMLCSGIFLLYQRHAWKPDPFKWFLDWRIKKEKFCAPLGARAQDIETMASMATTSNAAASGSLLIAIRERA